jgi:hypothetical protein
MVRGVVSTKQEVARFDGCDSSCYHNCIKDISFGSFISRRSRCWVSIRRKQPVYTLHSSVGYVTEQKFWDRFTKLHIPTTEFGSGCCYGFPVKNSHPKLPIWMGFRHQQRLDRPATARIIFVPAQTATEEFDTNQQTPAYLLCPLSSDCLFCDRSLPI